MILGMEKFRLATGKGKAVPWDEVVGAGTDVPTIM